MNKSLFIKVYILLVFILLINHLLTLVSFNKFYDKYLEDIFFNAVRAMVYAYLGICGSLNEINKKIIFLFGLILFLMDHIFLRLFYYLVLFWDNPTSGLSEYFWALETLVGSYIVFSPIILLVVFIGFSIGVKLKTQ